MKAIKEKQFAKCLTLFMVFAVILGFNIANAQQKQNRWLYLASDKPIQYQYLKVKEEGGRVFFKMQVKYDKSASTYSERSKGYTIYISRRTDNPEDSYRLYYKFYQSDNVVTLDHIFSVSKSNDDGRWLSYWDENLAFPMVKNKAGGEPEYLRFATWCIDSFNDDGMEEFNRCRRDFAGMTPIILGK